VRSTIALRWIIVRCPFVGLLLLLARLLGNGRIEFDGGAVPPFQAADVAELSTSIFMLADKRLLERTQGFLENQRQPHAPNDERTSTSSAGETRPNRRAKMAAGHETLRVRRAGAGTTIHLALSRFAQFIKNSQNDPAPARCSAGVLDILVSEICLKAATTHPASNNKRIDAAQISFDLRRQVRGIVWREHLQEHQSTRRGSDLRRRPLPDRGAELSPLHQQV